MKLSALDRKLVRDLWRMRGQAVAIALVIAAGVATFVSMASVMDTLQGTLERYYRDYQFPDGFASVRRAPEAVGARLREIPGVNEVETRVSAGVNLEVPGYADPVMGLIASIPEGRQPLLNRLFIRQGRLVRLGAEDEVLLNEVFAEAHGLAPGDLLEAVISGRRRTLTVVGIALSPEFLMQTQPGQIFPDPERFGILWMGREALSAAFDMEGAFNEVAFTLAPDARIAEVLDRMEQVLAPYGGQGAFARDDHPSHRVILEEFAQLETLATFLPAIFLLVAAFLLNIVVTRLIGLQREQIGILKAFGYRHGAIGLHYLKLVLLIALMGVALGTGVGAWMGGALGRLYLEYFRFPFLDYTLGWSVVLVGATLTTGAALVGAFQAIRRAVRLPPAEAMRPPAPPAFRPTVLERLGLQRFFDQPTRMILRSLERQPLKALLTVVGIASACAILVSGLFMGDVIDHIVRIQYGVAQREDLMVTFVEPASAGAVHELRGLPGVLHAEPFRSVPVRLRHEHRRYDAAVEGVPADGYLRQVLDTELRPVTIPPEGIVLTDRLAALLGVRPGEEIIVEVQEGSRPVRHVPVVGLAELYLGVGVYMDLGAANRLAGGGDAISGALLMVDDAFDDELNQALRDRPRVAGLVSQERAIQAYMDTAAESLLVMTFVLSLFAAVIAFGVLYNSVRISLSERDRELASLRVLGFTRGEIAYILLGEMAILVLFAIPVGFLLGAGLGAALLKGFETELYSFPFVLRRGTFALAALIVLASAAVSASIARRQLNRLDLVGVLKTRE